MTALRQYNTLFTLLLCCCMSLACSSVRLITDYDEVTDQMVMALQEKTTRHFVALDRAVGTEQEAYEHFISFYDDIKVGLSSLAVRSQALKDNTIVQQQVALLQQMTQDLESLHQLGIGSKEELQPLQAAFDSAYAAIIKLQLALKRGDQ